jgi:hypothetical protein
MKKLLDKFTDEEILKRLFELYPDQKKSLKGYKITLKELRSAKPKKGNMKVTIETVPDDLAEKDEPKEFVSVSGYLRGSNTRYGIGLDSLEILLGMEVTKKTFKNFTELDILAYWLWEITFYGYSSKQKEKVLADLKKSVADVESGKVKTVPWEEVKKKLK